MPLLAPLPPTPSPTPIDAFPHASSAALRPLPSSLVHGWCVDPQDSDTAAVIGRKSYNELVELVISTMDTEQVSRLGESLSLRRHSSLLPASSPSKGEQSAGPSTPTCGGSAAKSGLTSPASEALPGAAAACGPNSGSPALEQRLEACSLGSPGGSGGLASAALCAVTSATSGSLPGLQEGSGPPAELSRGGGTTMASDAPPSLTSPAPSTPAAPSLTPDQLAKRAYDAMIAKDFLEANCSQLTGRLCVRVCVCVCVCASPPGISGQGGGGQSPHTPVARDRHLAYLLTGSETGNHG